MSELILTYKDKGGKERQFEFDDETVEIDLHGKGITSIILESLKDHSEIGHLDLSANRIESIDLTPLTTCLGLEKLFLLGGVMDFVKLRRRTEGKVIKFKKRRM